MDYANGMWNFICKQRIFEIHGVKVGGNPGERPTVLIGTIFYRKQKMVKDDLRGEFDHDAAESLIKAQEEFSDKTGNPAMLDVVGASAEALGKALDFCADVTDCPLLLDGLTTAMRIETLNRVVESGLEDRIVYNSITPECKTEELEAIKLSGVKSVILLAYYPREFTSRGRLKAVRGLIPKLVDAGTEKILVDTCVLDIPSLGSACMAIFDVKNELGYPAGCGAHNAIGTWRGLRTKMGERAKRPCTAVADALPVSAGGDFVLYGPIEEAEYVFPSVALVDSAQAQLSIERGKRPSRDHPLYRIP